MVRKIIKVIVWLIVALFGVVILIASLLYVPAIQDFVKREVSDAVREKMGMELAVERLRIRFPLTLVVRQVSLTSEQADTLVAFDRVSARVALLPLIRKTIKLTHLEVENLKINYADSLHTTILKGSVGEFKLSAVAVNIPREKLSVSSLLLNNADIEIRLTEGDEQDSVSTPLGWKLDIDKIELNRINLKLELPSQLTELSVAMEQGEVDGCKVDLGSQDVSVGRVLLNRGDYGYFVDSTLPHPNDKMTTDPTKNGEERVDIEKSKPWVIALDRLQLVDNSVRYGKPSGVPKKGFDPNHIEITKLNLQLGSLYNRGTELRVLLRELSLRERCGFVLTQLAARVAIDSTEIVLDDFIFDTPSSHLTANIRAGEGLFEIDPKTPLKAEIEGRLSSADIFLILPPEPNIREMLRGKSLTIDGRVGGTIGALDISRLNLLLPGHLALYARGGVSSIMEPSRMVANVRLNGSLTDMDFLRILLDESQVSERIAFPKQIKLNGTIAVAGDSYAPNLRIEADSGFIDLNGTLNLKRESYEIDAKIDNLPLNLFLPHDSLGLLSMTLLARGEGFDIENEKSSAEVELSIDKFDYKRYRYHDIGLTAQLDSCQLKGDMESQSDALAFKFNFFATFHPDTYSMGLSGALPKADLQKMNFTPNPFSLSSALQAEVTVEQKQLYKVSLRIDTTLFAYNEQSNLLHPIELKATADTSAISADLKSGDLLATLNISVGVDSLLQSIPLITAELKRQLDVRDLNMVNLQESLIPVKLTVTAQRDNPIRTILRAQGIDFRTITANLSSENQPLRGKVQVNGLRTAGITFDTLSVGVGARDEKLHYYIRLANRPGNMEQLALFYIYGDVVHDIGHLNFYQRNRDDKVGFRLGVEGKLLDSALRFRVTPLDPTLAYTKWSVNEDNFVEYRFKKEIYADMRLASDSQRIELSSVQGRRLPKGSVKLEAKNIVLKQMLDLMPLPPPIDGLFNLSGVLGMNNKYLIGSINAGITEFWYDKQKIGKVNALFTAAIDTLNVLKVGAGIHANGSRVFSLKGEYDIDDTTGLVVGAKIEDLPLNLLNPFLPHQTARLDGVLAGEFEVTGTPDKLVLNGDMRFKDGRLDIELIGTSYGLTPEPIVMDNSVIRFKDFGVVAPNKKLLALNGTLDLRNFSRIYTDLKLTTKEFRVIGSSRSGGSQIYGSAMMDVNASLRGPLDAMSLRGGARLLNGTNVQYTLRDSPLDVEDKEQRIVKFVSFADTLEVDELDSLIQMRVWAMDMLLNIDIDENVKATLNLSESGNNRIELIGGGALAYSMNTQGDRRLSGRYVLSGGKVIYHPPIISTKEFKITDGSYVEWTGEMLNPSFNINAVERLKTTVTTATGTGSATFDVAVIISNKLDDMSMRLDLSSPGELQTDIASLTPEERSAQAMSLLLYNTYTGPGVTGKVDVNNPLSDFVAKEINQWARNNLKGIELSVGISSVEDGYGQSHTDYSYRVTKNLFSDRVKVTIGGSVSDEKSAERTKDNFIEDVSIEYRISKRDNMFLKAYRYNTQESILEGEVVETGGGFVVRKKMNHFGDLFKLTKNPEKKERRARKKLEKEVKREIKRMEEEKKKSEE